MRVIINSGKELITRSGALDILRKGGDSVSEFSFDLIMIFLNLSIILTLCIVVKK